MLGVAPTLARRALPWRALAHAWWQSEREPDAAERMEARGLTLRAAKTSGAKLPPGQAHVESALSRDELSQVRAVDRADRRHRARVRRGAYPALDRHASRLGAHVLGAFRRAGAVPDHHHADALVRRVYVRLVAGGDPGSRRTAHA